jgi:hypothetical protein
MSLGDWLGVYFLTLLILGSLAFVVCCVFCWKLIRWCMKFWLYRLETYDNQCNLINNEARKRGL